MLVRRVEVHRTQMRPLRNQTSPPTLRRPFLTDGSCPAAIVCREYVWSLRPTRFHLELNRMHWREFFLDRFSLSACPLLWAK